MFNVKDDVRLAVRRLRLRPSFTIVAILTLAPETRVNDMLLSAVPPAAWANFVFTVIVLPSAESLTVSVLKSLPAVSWPAGILPPPIWPSPPE